jgi:hypothetical protein
MKIFSGIKSVFSILNSVARIIGAFINKNPTEEEKEKIKTSPLEQEHVWEKKKPKFYRPEVLKKVNSKAKGRPHADTRIYNHPTH